MNEKLELEVTYPNGDREGLLVTRVEGNLFRLEESSLLEDAFYGDIVDKAVSSFGFLVSSPCSGFKQ